MDLLGRDITLAALAKGQQFVGRRQELLAQNIANATTPGYKRHDLDARQFSRDLAECLAAGGSREAAAAGIGDCVAREVVEEQFFVRPDKNGIDITRENTQLAEATSLGSILGALMSKRISMYKSVLRDGRV